MANFRVVQDNRSDPLAMMRLMFTGYSMQMQSQKMQTDEKYRNSMLALAENKAKEDSKLSTLQQSKVREGLKTQQILTRSANMAFVAGAVRGELENLNAIGTMYNIEDMDTLKQSFLLNMEKMKDIEGMPADMLDMYKRQGSGKIATNMIRANNIKELEQNSPHKIQALMKVTGKSRDELAGTGIADLERQYTDILADLDNNIALHESKTATAKENVAYFTNVINTKQVSSYDGKTGKTTNTALEDVSAYETALDAEFKTISDMGGRTDLLKNKRNTLNGTSKKNYQLKELEARQDRQNQKDAFDVRGGLKTPEVVFDESFDRKQVRDTAKTDRLISTEIYDDAQKEQLRRQAKYGSPLLDSLPPVLDGVSGKTQPFGF